MEDLKQVALHFVSVAVLGGPGRGDSGPNSKKPDADFTFSPTQPAVNQKVNFTGL
jgi:hypothetical protein